MRFERRKPGSTSAPTPVSDLEDDVVDVENLADDLLKFYDYKSSFSRYSMFMA